LPGIAPAILPMHAALTIALTGGLGSGKSTLARLLVALGAGLIDLDAIARELTGAGGEALGALRAEFGSLVLEHGGGLDRARVRALVFGDAAARARLEAVLHPMIWQRAHQKAELLAREVAYLVFDVPLLTAASVREHRFDRVLLVDCPVELQLARTLQRGGLDRTEIEAIVAAQPHRSERLALADDVVFNGASVAALQEHARRLHALYLAAAAARAGV
jgi:dephospho-CoA kinase